MMYVGNLSWNTTEQQLESMFGEHGPVRSAAPIADRDTERPRGFGFVEIGDEAGRAAIAALDGKIGEGRDLAVRAPRLSAPAAAAPSRRGARTASGALACCAARAARWCGRTDRCARAARARRVRG